MEFSGGSESFVSLVSITLRGYMDSVSDVEGFSFVSTAVRH